MCGRFDAPGARTALNEFLGILPFVISLIVIEGLLSVDNALAIAAFALALPREQQAFALHAGVVGAYAFRGPAILLAAFTIANPWLKLMGAAYLLYLMASNLVASADRAAVPRAPDLGGRGLFMTILCLEVIDLISPRSFGRLPSVSTGANLRSSVR